MSGERVTFRDQLELDDLGEVYEALFEISHKWYNIGLALGVQVSRLENIKQQHEKNFENCLLEMLKTWLKQIEKPRTWAALVDALKRKTVQECSVALAIQDKPDNIRRSMSEPADITSTAQAQVRQRRPVMETKASDVTEEAQYPNAQAQSCDEVPFTVALFTPSHSSPPSHHEDHDADVQESGEKPLFPYLDLAGLEEDDRRTLCGRLTNEYKKIISSYSKLNTDIRFSLTKRNVKPSQLANVLMELSAFPLRIRDGNKPLLEDCFEKIETAESIQAVFKILRPYGSFFDCHIIKHIVNSELCTDEDRCKLEKYLGELDGYCRRNVFECPHIASSDSKFPKLVVKVDDIVSKSFTMKALDAFSAQIAESLKLSRHTLRVCSVEEGCLQITYQLSPFVVDEIFPLTPEQQMNLKSIHIKSLTCGQEWVFDLSVYRAQPKKNVYSQLPRLARSHSGRSSGLLPKTGCTWYKLLGECSFGDNCHYGHLSEPIANPSIGIVSAPADKSLIGHAFQSSGGKGYVVLEIKEDHTKVEVIAEDDLTLEFAKRVILSPVNKGYSKTSRFKYIYVHPEGVKQANLFLKFDVYDRAPMTKTSYHLCKVLPSKEGSLSTTSKSNAIEEFEHLNPRCDNVSSLLDRVDEQETTHVYSTVQINGNYTKDIHEQLRAGLVWMHKKGFPHPKLEGRLGRVLWHKRLRDDCVGVERLLRFLVQRDTLRNSLFNSKFDDKSFSPFGALKSIYIHSHSSADEYMISLQPKNEGKGQHFVRVLFKAGVPEISNVTKHNEKDWVTINFDILCLHRKYDIRVSLRNIERVSTTDPSIQKFISSTLSLSDSGVIHYNPRASNEEWSLQYISHRKWETYNFRDSKYMLEISHLREYSIKEGDFSKHQISFESFISQHEVELHCTSWDHYSGRYAHSHSDSPSAPHSWSPDSVMEDFEKDGFLRMLDELNQTLELVSLSA